MTKMLEPSPTAASSPSVQLLSSKKAANMGVMAQRSNIFVMDDGPVTPLYLPGPYGQSFDQDLDESPAQEVLSSTTSISISASLDDLITTLLPPTQTLLPSVHSNNNNMDMKQQQTNNTIVKDSSSESNNNNTTLPNILESIPFDIDQFLSQNDNNIWDESDPLAIPSSEHLMLTGHSSGEDLMDRPVLMEEDPNGILMMDFEEMDPFSSFLTQAAPSPPGEGLELNLLDIQQPVVKEEVTTPDVIQTILQVTEDIAIKEEVKEDPDQLPAVVSDLNEPSIPSLPATPVRAPRKRSAAARRSTSSGSNSDLRRVKNNEASKRSRANRRQRQQGQVELVSILEDKNRSLAAQVKELEELKERMMFYMTNK